MCTELFPLSREDERFNLHLLIQRSDGRSQQVIMSLTRAFRELQSMRIFHVILADECAFAKTVAYVQPRGGVAPRGSSLCTHALYSLALVVFSRMGHQCAVQ